MRQIALLADAGTPKRVLALGAHPDDIEIGCGGTIIRLCAEHPGLEVLWVVFSGSSQRAAEARASAGAFLEGAARSTVVIRDFRDGFLPYMGAAVKDEFEALRRDFEPDMILTHFREDRHQDHRLVSDLTWNTWRDHLILEYEIPKYDGDLGAPNIFASLSAPLVDRKIDLLTRYFPSQTSRSWFTPDLFRAVARIRGMECATGFAEAFYVRKARF